MVIGTIGNTHGVSSESAPIVAASHRKSAKDSDPCRDCGGVITVLVASTRGAIGAAAGLTSGSSFGSTTAASGAPSTRRATRTVSSVGGRQYDAVHV